MNYEEYKEIEKSIMPFTLVDKSDLVGKTIKKVYESEYSSLFIVIEFTDGTGIYINSKASIDFDNYVSLVGPTTFDGKPACFSTTMGQNFVDSGVINFEQLNTIMDAGREYATTMIEEDKKKEIEKLKKRLKELEGETE